MGLTLSGALYVILQRSAADLRHNAAIEAAVLGSRFVALQGQDLGATSTDDLPAASTSGGGVLQVKIFDAAGRLVRDPGSAAAAPNPREAEAISTVLSSGVPSSLLLEDRAVGFAPMGGRGATPAGVVAVTSDQSAIIATVNAATRLSLLAVALVCALACLIPAVASMRRRSAIADPDPAALKARFDPLTEVLNRRALEDAAREVFGTDRPAPNGHGIGVLVIDIDGLGAVNDKLGQAGGDAFLRFVASAIADKTRSDDIVGRLDGDRFVLLMPGAPAESVRRRADAIRLAARGEFSFRNVTWRGSISLGMAQVPRSMSFDEAITRAGAALTAAKDLGGNRIEVFDPDRMSPEPVTGSTATAA